MLNRIKAEYKNITTPWEKEKYLRGKEQETLDMEISGEISFELSEEITDYLVEEHSNL